MIKDIRHNMRTMYAHLIKDKKEVDKKVYKQELEHFTDWYNNLQNKTADIIFAHFKKYYEIRK